MDDQKPWWQSKGVIGSIVSMLAALAAYFHISIPTEVQSQLIDALFTLVAVVGSLLGIIGRIVATKKLK